MSSRRRFLANSSLLALSGYAACNPHLAAWGLPPEDPFMANMGIQLYTVRNQMQANAAKTIESIAAAGYKQVELMDVMGADQIVPMAKENNMGVTSAFIQWNILGEPKPGADVPSMEKAIEMAHKHGIKYLVFGYIGKGFRETADQLKGIAERTNRAGEACKKAGIQLCYHHHSFEFQPIDGGKTGMDVFIENFDKELAKFELDVFWAAIGGWDPVKTLEKLAGRVAQVHLKDLLPATPTIFDEGKVPKEAFKEVGAGNIDMKSVVAAAKRTGVAQCHVEQDQSPDPIASIQLSLKNLRAL